MRENRRDRRLRQYQSGKRKVVVVIRERGGNTLPGVFRTEADALNFIRKSVPVSTELYADEAGSWNALHARYTLHRINHQEAYSLLDKAQKTAATVRDNLGLRASYGLSVFWNAPVGPIRLDFSKIIRKEPYDRTEGFRFSTSTQF